jgi:hypothetical protein
MVLADGTTTLAAPRPAAPAAAAAGRRFTWVALLLAAWPLIGGHVDGWAHKHLPLETFFTPWHALLYSGLLANAAVLGWRLLAGRRAGLPWSRALPAGYGLSLAGCALFAAGGALDLGWHLAFGIERRFAANVSPTHLLLMLSVGLIAGGPLRAAWRRGGRLGLPGLLSATMVLSTLTFFGQFDQPYTDQWVAAPAPPVAPPLSRAAPAPASGPRAAAPAPAPAPAPPAPAVTEPQKPGWGCGDANHAHAGPGGKGADHGSPCKSP